MIITKPQVDIDIVINSLLKGGVVNVPIQGPIGLFNTLVELIKSNKKKDRHV
jgi:hypothetical protein